MIEHNHRWMEGDDELKRKIKQGIDHMRLTLSPEFPGVSVYWYGAVRIDPRHLGIWSQSKAMPIAMQFYRMAR